jgi:uncharacterized protein YggE
MNRRVATAVAVLVAVTVAVVALTSSATGQTTEDSDGPSRTITVSSVATISTTPDEAVVTFGVRSDDADSVIALDETSRTMNQVIAAMRELGITQRDMETTNVNLSQQTLDRGTPSERTVFVSSTTLEVTIGDFDRIGAAIRAGVQVGATSVRGVQFQVSDPADAKRRALQAAVRGARSKADALAEAAGATVTGIVQIREEGRGTFPSAYRADEALLQYGAADLSVVPPRNIETEVTVTTIWSIG